jgi:TIR domain
MTNKLQISQSIRVVHTALITHLDSFERRTLAFRYDYSKDYLGIHHFYLRLNEDGYSGSHDKSNLGSVRLRPLGSKLTEIAMEDSVWLKHGPNMVSEWDLEEEIDLEARKASFDRIRSIHQEVREYIIEALQEDRLLLAGTKKSEKSSQEHKSAPTPTQVFISYAHEDIKSARKVYEQLKAVEGITPWFDKESLLPGMRWRPAIKKAIRESDFFLALLSKTSTAKRGYVQTEMKEALQIWDQFPEGKAYLIPVRLEACEPSYEKLREVQCEDFFPSWDRGFQRILRVIDDRAHRHQIRTQASLPTGYEYRCAIVDFDNGLTNLAQICQRLNSIQNFFHFSFPSFPYEPTALRDFGGQSNLYVPALPKSLYRQKGLLNADLVACLTKYLLAFKEGRKTLHDYLSLPSEVDDTFLFITTYDLYETAKKAGCTFEKSVVYHILTQLLVHFASDLGFHTEVRGCILDFCEEHSWMIKGMKRMELCSSCARGIENEDLKRAVLAILADPLKV